MGTIKEYPQLIDEPYFELWSEINEQELTCIFAETGIDRELDYDREKEEERLFLQQNIYKIIKK